MHITRWLAFVPATALSAACAAGGGQPKTGGWVQGRDALVHDVALAAIEQPLRGQAPVWLDGAVVCRPSAPSAPSAAAERARAARLLELGKAASLMGNVAGARDLLRQAAYLDGTSPTAAYHLARASEVAGDTATAVREYCRYLSFGVSGSERAEVRERLLLLAPPGATPASRSRVSAAPSRRASRAPAPRVSAPTRSTRAPITAATGAAPRPTATTRDGSTYEGRSDGAVASESVGTAGTTRADSVERAAGTAAPRPVPPPRTPARRTARDAAVGAVIGAAAGAVVSRDVKGAVIGAAAGGLMGAILGRP